MAYAFHFVYSRGMESCPPQPDPKLAHLPPDLLAAIAGDALPADILVSAAHDLDAQGRYAEGFLILTDAKLGHFSSSNSSWQGQWLDLKKVTAAHIVDGLGMSLLRLLEGESVAAEYRFTLRHAREVAALHRLLEKRITGKEEEALEPHHQPADEKKIRCDKCQRVIPPWAEVCPACLSRRKVLSRLMDFVRPYRLQAGAGFLLATLAALAGLFRPYLTKPMLDDGLGMRQGASPNYGLLLGYVALMAFLLVFAAIAGAIRERLMATLGSKISRDIRDRTYQHLHKLSLSFFSKKPTGSLVTRITSDSDRIWDFVAFTIIEVAMSLLTLFGVAGAMFFMNWKLALIVLLPIPLMLVLMIWFHQKLHKGFDRLFHRWSVMTAIVADALPGVRVTKAFSQEKREVKRFADKNEDFYADEVNMITLWTLFGPVMQFCSQVGTLLVWIVGGWWVVRDYGKAVPEITGGTLMAFTGYMWMFYGPIHMVAHIDRMLNRAASSVQRIFEVLDTAPGIYSKHEARRPEGLQGAVELRNVSFSYDGVRKVLRNVSLKIAPGEMIGLAGPSGGGKTTLVNLICRFYDVLEGQILVDGVDVRDYDVQELRRHVGLVLQEPFLFHGSVAKNIAYGRPDVGLDEIIVAAKAANAHDFIVGFPDGYDTMVGERGHTLSGGERQRISIARAVLNNPRILILDEATSSVDTETEKLIQAALDRLIADRTTIAIAHRLSTLRKADRLVILDKGQIVEEGTHEQLSAKEGGTYAKLIRMQTEMQAIMAIG